MRIGTIDFGDCPLFLAPMEDVTDASFRLLSREFGADLVVTEFVNADAIVRSVPSTLKKMSVSDEERPVAIQLYGRTVDSMVEAAKIVETARPDIIDLNFGCPVKRVAGKGAGSGLLQNIPLLLEITAEVVKAVRTPVTVKTRLGWDAKSIVIEELAEQLQDVGVSALTIHGRTRAQMYKGEANWDPIRRVATNDRIHIPIIGNGDITTGEEAKRAFKEYGVDAVMVGRATVGQPWIFEEMRAVLRGEPAPTHTKEWYLQVLIRLLDNSIAKCSDELKGILHVRRHLANTPLFKGIPNFRQHRIAILQASSRSQLLTLLHEALEMTEEK